MTTSKQETPRLLREGVFFWKMICDGYDLLHSPYKQQMNNLAIEHANKHCFLDLSSFDSEAFISQCIADREHQPSAYIPEHLQDKYELGFFQPSIGKVANSDYVLFNDDQIRDNLAFLGLDLTQLQFWVMPSRDECGVINNIAFRIINHDFVNKAFKWIFTCGNISTFGLDKLENLDSETLVVEGFRDYVAFNESGKQAIGLGSVLVCDYQWQKLGFLSNKLFVLDNDQFGNKTSLNLVEKGHRVALLENDSPLDPYDLWLQDPNSLTIMEMK